MRRRIREALGLFVDNVENVTLTDDVRMPKRVAEVVKNYRAARQRAAREQQQASATARRAVKALAGGRLHLSRRDVGEVLGISAQRVQQLLETADDRNGPKRQDAAPSRRRSRVRASSTRPFYPRGFAPRTPRLARRFAGSLRFAWLTRCARSHPRLT